MTLFVLLSQQRSGTSALTSFISKHPKVNNLHEILNPHNTDQEDNFFAYWLANDPVRMMKSSRSPSDLFVEFVESRKAKYPDSNLLFDIKLNCIHHVLNYWHELPGFTEARLPWLFAYLQRQRTPVLYLYRDNHFQRYVSAKISELTGVYRSNKPSLSVSARLVVDADDLYDYICRSERAHQDCWSYLEQFDRVLPLAYEDVFAGSLIRPKAKTQIGEFLGVEPQLAAEPYYMKQNPAKLEKVVINYDDVCNELIRLGKGGYVEGPPLAS